MRTAAIIVATLGSPACADVPVVLHATYLSAPTTWCAADKGVPVVITMNGLDVFGETSANVEQPASVTVRRGGQATERINVGRVGVAEVRSRRGVDVTTIDTTRIRGIEPRVGDVEPLGTLFAKMTRCESFWSSATGATEWRVEDGDGATVMSGSGYSLFSPSYGFLGVSGSYPRAFKIGDQVFVVMEEPRFVRTTEAFASPAKEQDQ